MNSKIFNKLITVEGRSSYEQRPGMIRMSVSLYIQKKMFSIKKVSTAEIQERFVDFLYSQGVDKEQVFEQCDRAYNNESYFGYVVKSSKLHFLNDLGKEIASYGKKENIEINTNVNPREYISDDEDVEEAISKALKQAEAKANVIALYHGVKLDGINSVEETGVNTGFDSSYDLGSELLDGGSSRPEAEAKIKNIAYRVSYCFGECSE